MKSSDIRKVLLNPSGAIDALAVPEVAFHSKVLAWAQDDPGLAYLESMERAAMLILDSGPTATREEFVLNQDAQDALMDAVRQMGGMYGYRNSELTWIPL